MKKNIYKMIIMLTVIVAFSSTVYASNNEIRIAVKNSTSNNTIEDPVARNNDLKSLKVEGYDIYPEFDKNITTYYCMIGKDTKSIDLEASADNEEDATVKITGNTSLTKDENTISIVVTSKAGTKKTYTVIAKKQNNVELALESLSIENATNEIALTEGKYQYEVEVKQQNEISPLNITAVANNSEAVIEILGNDENLLEGDNTITIILRDTKNTVIYQINAKIKTLKETQVVEYVKGDNLIVNLANDLGGKIQEFFKDEQKTLIFLCVVAGILLVAVIIFIIRIVRRNKITKNKENIKNRV